MYPYTPELVPGQGVPNISVGIQVSKMAGSAASTPCGACQPQTRNRPSMTQPLGKVAMQRGGCTSNLPPGSLQCPRCRAMFKYGQEGIRDITNQAKQLFLMVEKEDDEYVGREAGAGAKSTSRRSNGVFGGLRRGVVTRLSGAVVGSTVCTLESGATTRAT